MFSELLKNYPKSIFAQKSLTYAGIIYERDLKMYDSVAHMFKFNDYTLTTVWREKYFISAIKKEPPGLFIFI